MREVVIGANGFIGRALMSRLPEAGGVTRRQLDLLGRIEAPRADVIYLCAGVNGTKACEGSQNAFRVNVDAPIELAVQAGRNGSFMVFISSMSLEWLSTAYQRHKLAAESVLRTMPWVGVVRAGRVVSSNVDDLCATLVRVGRERVSGLTRWGSDDIAYER